MSHCSSVGSQPAQGSSTGARLLQMLRADRAPTGCGKAGRKRTEPPPPPPPPPPAPPSCGNGADAKSLFEVLSAGDADGNGTLSSREIGKTAAAGLMSDVFGKIDSDGDGELNAGEVGAYESAVDEVLKVMGSEAGIAGIVAKAGESTEKAPREDDRGRNHGQDRAEGPRGGQSRHGYNGNDRGGIRMDEATATVVADALIGVLEAMDGNRDGTLTARELDRAVGPEVAADDATAAPADAAAATKAAPVSEAPAKAAEEAEADANGDDTGGPTTGTASPNSLSAAIFASLTRQIGESDDTTQLAHQYTKVLHTLKG